MTRGLLAVAGLGLLAVAGVVGYHSLGPEPPRRDVAQEARDDLQRRNFKPLSAPLAELLADPAYVAVPTQADPLLGKPAPDFTLADVEGKAWPLADAVKDGPVVLVFYYGYHCDHCVSQLFALDKDLAKFRELGATVVAVSADPPETTRERYKQYGAFGFPVLTDPGFKVAQGYHTFAPGKAEGEDGNQLHGTFVIDRRGHVAWANRGDQPFTENRTLLIEIHRRNVRP